MDLIHELDKLDAQAKRDFTDDPHDWGYIHALEEVRRLAVAYIEHRQEADEETTRLVTELRGFVADLADPDPCWYDHHGYCQAHGWSTTTPACPHARARQLTQETPRA
jgi:hypothetical protein